MSAVLFTAGLRLALALWVGAGVGIGLLASPVVFAKSPTRQLAGDTVGGMLRRLDGLTLACLAAAVACLVGLGAGPHTLLLKLLVGGMGAFALVSQLLIGPRIAALRADMGVIDDVPKSDPRRRRFGALHGVSVLLLLAQLVLGAVALVLVP